MSVEQAPVQRADFDQVMVPNYSPAAFIPVRGEVPASGTSRVAS